MGNKVVGITLAVCSGVFIGVSFVFKKKGLLDATKHSNGVAGEGYAYLKNWVWWLGMTLMIVGEVCNFVAYAFTEAILVTPLGALSVVVAAIGSSIFLKERLSFIGKIGCFLCILGAVIIVLNAPEQTSVSTIQEMKHFVISKVFLPYAAVAILVASFLAFWAGPRYGKTNVFVYISICSIIGGISVVCTQGFGASVVSAISGVPDQWNNWFLWILFIFVVCTLLVEIVFLNKALNIFNTSIVTPIYFTYFTTMTLISSAVLFQGFNGSPVSIITVILGFLCIVAGVVLLQVSLAAQTKSDSQMLKAELDDVQDVLQAPVDDDQLNPGPASIRGALSVRRFATRKVSNASQLDSMRRRQTMSSSHSTIRTMQPQTQYMPQMSYDRTNEHASTIKFVNPSISATSADADTHVSSSPFYLGQHLPLHAKNDYLPRTYTTEVDWRSQHSSNDRPPLPSIPDEERGSSRGSSTTSRLKKQFSFAVRGRGTGLSEEEESVGLTRGLDKINSRMDDAEGDEASDESDSEVHRAL